MELDIKKVMVLLQRKYNAVRELNRLTHELDETVARNDEVSVAVLLQMRDDEVKRIELCTEELGQMREESREANAKISMLVDSDPTDAAGETPEEELIYEIRRKTQAVLKELQRVDERLNRRLTGKKSFYK